MNPELIYKYLENTATDDEMKQVLDWLDADPAHVRELDELDKVMAASVIYGPDVLSPALARKAARRISLGRIPLRRIVRYAAELAAVAVVGVGLARMLADDRIGEWARRTTALEVPAGQYLSMELQDGTKVWLNAGTRLEYPLVFAGGERRVKVAGEAMFDVEHDPAHPFVVETFALLTSRCWEQIRRDGRGARGIVLGGPAARKREGDQPPDAGEQFVLKPNEEVWLAGRRLNLNAIGSMDDYLWTEGMISIKGLSFGELMHKFEKSFGVKIRIDRARMPEVDYNHGKIRISDGVDSALRLLQMASDFTYTRSEDNGTIVIR